MIRIALPGLLLFAIAAVPACAGEYMVTPRSDDDQKAVIATVEPVHELIARARLGGTITSLAAREGDQVAAGDRVAVVVDQKLLFQIEALDSRIRAQQAERDQAQLDLTRAQELRRSGAGTQVALDQAKTCLDIAERTPQALSSDRQVIEQQTAEGAVLAPGSGRVLKVPVSQGSVVLSGETIATIAAENYILRLQLPERHARFITAAMIGAGFIMTDPIFQGLAISLVFGLASSTILTVLVIPSLYVSLRDDHQEWAAASETGG